MQQLTHRFPSRSWQYQYNHQGLIATVDGPRNDVEDITRYTYDDLGRRIATTNAIGHTSDILAFNAVGLPTEIRDANGVITQLIYNQRGWLISKTLQGPAGDEITRYQYNGRSRYNGGGAGMTSSGLIAAVIAPDGGKVSYQYDAGGRVISVANPRGESIHYTLDAAGNPVKEVVTSQGGELVRQHAKVFDELSRLLSIVGSDGVRTDYRYDKAGNRISTTDGLGNQTAFAFDALNRLVITTDALKGDVHQRYNDRDQLVAVEDQRGLVTEYRYNGFGDKIAQISPDTGETLYGYDEAGNLIVRRNAKQDVSEYQYDALNRLTAVHYPAANDEDIAYVYDHALDSALAIGRVAQVTNSSGQTTYSYNHRGQVVSQVYQLGGKTYRNEHHYDRVGQLVTSRYPGGRVVNYERQQGQLAAITTIAASNIAQASRQPVVRDISYQAFGVVDSINYGNGLQLNVDRDQNARIEQLIVTNAANEPVYNKAYRFDYANNIVAIDDAMNEGNSEQFAYDALHRLTHAEGNYGDIKYRFDAAGNRISRKTEGRKIESHQINSPKEGSEQLATYRYDDSSNRLLAVDSTRENRQLAYDAVGNITLDQRSDNDASQDNRQLIYGANNRLQAVEGQSFVATYIYNAKGQRVIKQVSRDDGEIEETHFHYGLNNQLIAETKASQQLIREYLYLGTQRVAMVDHRNNRGEEGQLVFIHNDHLGTPKMMTDEKGDVVWSTERLPYGEAMVASLGGIENPLGFPGQYRDDETGYSYNYFRDYDPSLGRYLQSDPIGLGGGVNTFAYVSGNPVGAVDPFGLDSYLVSRPLDGIAGSVGRHMFVVHHSTGPGTGVVRSYGKSSGSFFRSGKMGAVTLSTKGMSAYTNATDTAWWGSNYNSSDVKMTQILAADNAVAMSADSLISEYGYRLRGVNSNSAAQAIANDAAGTAVATPGGWHPGVENADLVNFSGKSCPVP